MKKIPEPRLESASDLTPMEMNSIHFGGNRTPLTPGQLEHLINSAPGASGPSPAPDAGTVEVKL